MRLLEVEYNHVNATQETSQHLCPCQQPRHLHDIQHISCGAVSASDFKFLQIAYWLLNFLEIINWPSVFSIKYSFGPKFLRFRFWCQKSLIHQFSTIPDTTMNFSFFNSTLIFGQAIVDQKCQWNNHRLELWSRSLTPTIHFEGLEWKISLVVMIYLTLKAKWKNPDPSKETN